MINKNTGKFVFNFFDCENTHLVFQDMSKMEDNEFVVLIKKGGENG